MPQPYDALLLLSFGGPERREDVIPFLENVLRGKSIPRERMLEVAEHYYLFDGVSPINEQNRALLTSLIPELTNHGIDLPVYWGNRNWHPMLVDTVRQMAEEGVTRALAFATSAFASYSGCRQYLEDIERACADVGPEAPQIDKMRLFHNHPGFIEPMTERVFEALQRIDEVARSTARLVFTAHSLPIAMADACAYVNQLRDACQLVAERLGRSDWDLVYQSRSGPPSQPWLEPDICDHLRNLRDLGCKDAIIAPIGFLSEHMEVIYDLDVEAAQVAEEIGLNLVRSSVVGNHPRFVAMIRELVQERLTEKPERLFLGNLGASPDQCAPDCCKWQSRRPT